MTCSRMDSSLGHGTQNQWNMTGEDNIDSVQHKRHRFTENNQRNDDHFFGGPSSEVNSSTETSHSGQTSSEPHGPEYVPPSNDSASPSSAIADDEDPLQKPCEMHSWFIENNQRNDDHFFGGPSAEVNSSTETSHSGQTSSEPHGPEYIPHSNDSASPSSAIADDEDPLQKPCEMHSWFTENNQRNDDHFFGGPSAEVNSSTETSHSGQTSSEPHGPEYIPPSNILSSPSSPIADVEDSLRNPCGMHTRFTENNQRNDDQFWDASSSKVNPGMVCSRGVWETPYPGNTSSHLISPTADFEESLRKPCGEPCGGRCVMCNRSLWISRKKLGLDGPLRANSRPRWNSQVFPSQHDKAANFTLSH